MNINSLSNRAKTINMWSFRARLTVEMKGRKHAQ